MLVRRGAGWALRAAGEPEAPVDLADHDPDAPRGARRRRRPRPRARGARPPRSGSRRCPPARPSRCSPPTTRASPRCPTRSAPGPRSASPTPDPARSRALLDAGSRARASPPRRSPATGRLRAPGPGARDARAPRRAAARPSRARARDRHAGRRRLVAALTELRGGDADGVARVRRLGPARAPAPARVLRDARRPGAAAPRAARSRAAAAAISDPDVFLDVSSYGARAVDAVLREVGVDRLVHGSDRPVVAAPPSCRSATPCDTALRERNPARLLAPPHGGPRMTTIPRSRPPARSRRARAARAGQPDRRRPGAVARRSCATTRRSATSSSSGATTTSTSGSSPGPTATTPASTTTTSRTAPSPSSRASSSRSASCVGGPPRQLRHRAGETFDFDASHVHRMRQDNAALAVSDPRLLAAAVAHGGLRGRRRRHAAPRVDLQRRGAAARGDGGLAAWRPAARPRARRRRARSSPRTRARRAAGRDRGATPGR